jgi:[protein-PII] uridylyltransferase
VGLRSDLAALDRAYSAGHHGLWMARRRSDLLDAAVVRLFSEAGAPQGVALAAVGGFGRQQQLPHSDVDLLIIHPDSADEAEVAGFVERLLYPLWDDGIEVGQAVRTLDQCVLIAEERLDALTAMLDLRWLAGDEGLTAEAHERVLAPVRADPSAFAVRLREAAEIRRRRFGSVAHLLKPELKEGEGGLRDIASLGWLAHAVGPLEIAGLLRERERDAVDAAAEFLTRVRGALHLETGVRTDRLLPDQQPSIARAMGFQDRLGLIAEDGLMRAVFEHGRQVAHVTRSVFGRYLDERVVNGETVEVLPHDAAGVLEVLADGAEVGDVPSPGLLDAIEASDIPDPVGWTDEIRGGFLRLLRAGGGGVDALETLDRLGLLTHYLPAWADVRCRPQRDPYHLYTVDRHLTGALREVDRMLSRDPEPNERSTATDDGDDPIERDAVSRVQDPDAVRLGALLHDIGKVGEGGHLEIGARVAAETLAHMGVPGPTRELAAFMAAHHLLLPDTATRRDLTAEDLILDVASKIGSPERLAALYLLAKADALATGPAAWTPWRQALVRELVVKVQRTFDRGEMGEELAERLTERIERLRELLQAEPEDGIERFVMTMPRGYFLTVDPARAASHYATIAPEIGSLEVRTADAPGPRPGTYELLVVAADRPGLLSWIAGALALAGLSILAAQVFTTDDGTAVDLFEVEGVFEAEVTERRWRELRTTLRKAVEGQITLDARVREKRAYYPPKSDAPVTVTLDNDVSDFSTVIEVGAPDRIGLLYDITSTLADLRLDVHVAKVATYTDRVIDAFYVRDGLGGKVTDPAQIAEIEAVVYDRLEDPSARVHGPGSPAPKGAT